MSTVSSDFTCVLKRNQIGFGGVGGVRRGRCVLCEAGRSLGACVARGCYRPLQAVASAFQAFPRLNPAPNAAILLAVPVIFTDFSTHFHPDLRRDTMWRSAPASTFTRK